MTSEWGIWGDYITIIPPQPSTSGAKMSHFAPRNTSSKQGFSEKCWSVSSTDVASSWIKHVLHTLVLNKSESIKEWASFKRQLVLLSTVGVNADVCTVNDFREREGNIFVVLWLLIKRSEYHIILQKEEEEAARNIHTSSLYTQASQNTFLLVSDDLKSICNSLLYSSFIFHRWNNSSQFKTDSFQGLD